MFFTGALELSIASFTVQIILGLYQSKEDFENGRWIEGSAHLLMSAVQVNQLSSQIEALSFRNQLEENLKQSQSIQEQILI